tara:strand:- start:16849 stop:17037 length:189 start_codon:yes stop_codon:yes gene_type:complete
MLAAPIVAKVAVWAAEAESVFDINETVTFHELVQRTIRKHKAEFRANVLANNALLARFQDGR